MGHSLTMAALTGLRRGELCGLKWPDVDWEDSAITVRRSIWQTTTAGWGEKDPKSHQIQHLLLGEHAMGVLAGKWQRVRDAAALAEVTLSDDAFIFGTDIAGLTPTQPDAVTSAFARLCRRIGAPAGQRSQEGWARRTTLRIKPGPRRNRSSPGYLALPVETQ
jgi:integrase